MFKKLFLCLFILLGMSSLTFGATTYYVDSNTGLDANNGDATHPWQNLSRANGTGSPAVAAGDTVIMAVGSTFGSSFTPAVDGDAVLGYITYQGAAAPVNGGTNAKVRNFIVTGRHHIRIKWFEITGSGFTDTAADRILSAGSGTNHIRVEGNLIHDFLSANAAIRFTTATCSDSIFDGNTILNAGSPWVNGSGGRKSGFQLWCDHSLIQNNDVSGVGDYTNFKGSYTVWRNNYFHDSPNYDSPNNHIDGAQIDCQSSITPGSSYILIEGNTRKETVGMAQQHFILSNATASCGGVNYMIGRYNIVQGGEGFWVQNCCTSSGESGVYTKVYNNTAISSAFVATGAASSVGSTSGCSTAITQSAPRTAGTLYTTSSTPVTTTNLTGSGSGVTVDIVASGAVTVVTLHDQGSGYNANDRLRINAGNSDADFYICGVENAQSASVLDAIQHASYINNLHYDAVTNTFALKLYSFGTGRLLDGTLTAGGAGYANTNNVSASGAPCRSGSIKFDLTTSGGAVTGITRRADGLSCTANTIVSIAMNGTSGTYDVTESAGTYMVSIHTAGSGYVANGQWKILGSALGGRSPDNDLIITVTTVNGSGAITGTSVSGTATGSATQTNLSASGYSLATFRIDHLQDDDNVARSNLGFLSVNPGSSCTVGLTGAAWTTPFTSETFVGNALQGRQCTDPQFVSSTDFHLRDTSPANSTGSHLTNTVGSGASSTTLTVGDAAFFQAGWGPDDSPVQADWIAVGNVTNIAQITTINYSTNQIGLDRALTWLPSDPVYLYKDSSGNRVFFGTLPNIGAMSVSPIIPSLTSITPNVGTQNHTTSVTLSGANFTFDTPTILVSGSGITVSNLVVVSDTTITADLVVSAGAATGVRTVRVETAEGDSTTVNFTINVSSDPTITSITPSSGYQTSTIAFTITGTNLTGGSVAISGTGITVQNVVVVNSTTITGQFVIGATASIVSRNVTVTASSITSNAASFQPVSAGYGRRGRIILRQQ